MTAVVIAMSVLIACSASARLPRAKGLHVRAPGVALRRTHLLSLSDASNLESAAQQAQQAQAEVLKVLTTELQLETEDEFDETFEMPAVGQVKARVRSFSSQPTNVAWASAFDVGDGNGFSESMLSMWLGPLIAVPHMRTRVAVREGGVDLSIDFFPRADGAYETQLPDGSFPEPASREAFAHAAVRREQDELFFTAEVRAWEEAVRALPGAMALAEDELARSAGCAGPVSLGLRLPPDGVKAACNACADAARFWLAWVLAAPQLGQVKSMQTFAHDCKVRARVAADTAERFECAFGAEAGRTLARMDAGPVDLADRGGAMNAAATGNFDEAGTSTQHQE